MKKIYEIKEKYSKPPIDGDHASHVQDAIDECSLIINDRSKDKDELDAYWNAVVQGIEHKWGCIVDLLQLKLDKSNEALEECRGK